jgi:hypothetical protein
MIGVAVEQMLELWCVELRQVKAHLRSDLPPIAWTPASSLFSQLARV